MDGRNEITDKLKIVWIFQQEIRRINADSTFFTYFHLNA